MRPSIALQGNREVLRRIALANNTANPRIFGSVVRGTDSETSDIDLLVDPIQGKTTLLSLVRIKDEAESALGVPVDIATPGSLKDRYRDQVLREARAL